MSSSKIKTTDKTLTPSATAGSTPSLDIFSPEERETILETFGRLFGASLRRGERFGVVGSVVETRLIVAIEIADPDRTEVATFEVGHAIGGDDDVPVIEARARAIEFGHEAVSTYLQSDRWPAPHMDWREYTFDGKPLYFRGTVRNEKVEAAADAFLAEAEAAGK